MQRRDSLKGAGALAAAAAAGMMNMAYGETEVDQKQKRAERYLDSWNRKDAEGIGQYLHPEVHFKSPTIETTGKEVFLDAANRIFPMLQSLLLRHWFVSEDCVVAIYDFNCIAPVGVSRTAELIRFEDGWIKDVELFFDARPFVRPANQ